MKRHLKEIRVVKAAVSEPIEEDCQRLLFCRVRYREKSRGTNEKELLSSKPGLI